MEMTLLRGSLLATADSTPIQDGGVLFGRDGRVVESGDWSRVAALAGPTASQVDHRPHWLVPGMIDLHVHTTLPGDGRPAHDFYSTSGDDELRRMAESNALAGLRAGVTTMRDCGGRSGVVLGLRDDLASGRVLGPRLFVAGPPMTPPTGHAHYMGGVVEGSQAILECCKNLLREGVDFLKAMGSGGGTPGTEEQITTFTIGELQAMRKAAHDAGTHLAVHATNLQATRQVVEAGVDTLEHASMMVAGEDRFDPRLADQIAERGIIVSPTLQTSVGDMRALERLAETRTLSASEKRQSAEWRQRTSIKVDQCVRMMNHGVAVACSTDAGWRINRFGDFVDGLELLASAGVDGREVFRSATATPARALGQEHGLGCLIPGAHADVLVVPENPVVQISTLRTPIAVYRGGNRIG